MIKQLIRILVVLSCLSQTACVSHLLTGVQLVYDRQELKKTLDNYHVEGRARRKLTPELRRARHDRVIVETFNRDLLLVGQVPSQQEKERLGALVENTKGVREIFNQIRIEPKANLSQIIKDTWISTKLSAALLARNDINHQSFNVVTENGIVYLMGDVKPAQAKKACDLARAISGVREVVKVFRYYHYVDKLALSTP